MQTYGASEDLESTTPTTVTVVAESARRVTCPHCRSRYVLDVKTDKLRCFGCETNIIVGLELDTGEIQ